MLKHTLSTCVVVSAITLGGCGGGSSNSPGDMPAADDIPTEGSTPDAGEEGDPDTSGGNDNDPVNQPGSLAMAIQGSWMGTCSNFESQGFSVRQINVVTDNQVILDFYEYDGNDCTGVPRGQLYPLRTYDYTLGSDVAADDGITATQVDLTITQLSNAAYLRDGAQLGLTTYDIVGVNAAGNLLNTRADSRNIDNRPTSFDNALVMTPRGSLTPSTITAQSLAGTYSPGCKARTVGSSLVTETLDENGTLTTIEEFHFNDTCAGEPDAATQRITQYQYGENRTSVFGDTYLQAVVTQNAKTILYGDEALSSLSLGELKIFYDAISLVDNTLIRGDCVERVEQCKKDTNHYADMLDFEFNSSVRYTRIEP